MEAIVYLLVICIIWSLYYISIYTYYKKFSLKVTNFDSLMVVRHNCYSFNARHIYLIKLSYGRARKKFFFLTTILLEFIDPKGRPFLTIKIPPQVLFESQKEGFKEGNKGKAKLLAFILQTRIPIITAEGVRISHDCKAGDLFIYDIRIIDLMTQDSYISFVQSWIKFLSSGTHPRAQIFSITVPGRNLTDIKPTKCLHFPETFLFYISGIHYILFHTQYAINSFEKWIFAKNYDSIATMVLTAILSASFSIVLESVSIVIYYYSIKRTYAELKGIGLIWIVRFAYLFFIVCLSFVLGLTAAFKPEDTSNDINPLNDSQWNSSTLKWFAMIVGIVVYSLAFFSIVLCFQFCGFCKDREEYELRSENDKSYKSVKTVSKQEMKTDSNKSITGMVGSSRDSPRTERNLINNRGLTTKSAPTETTQRSDPEILTTYSKDNP